MPAVDGYVRHQCEPAHKFTSDLPSIGAGGCGTVRNAAGSTILNLDRGGTYLGGGNVQPSLPAVVPNNATVIMSGNNCNRPAGQHLRPHPHDHRPDSQQPQLLTGRILSHSGKCSRLAVGVSHILGMQDHRKVIDKRHLVIVLGPHPSPMSGGGAAERTMKALRRGGGASMWFPTPIRGTASSSLMAQCVTSGAGAVVIITAFKAP